MKVISYLSSVADEAPAAFRCAARILLPSGQLHPCVFHGPDKVTVRERAQAWWDEQIAAERRKQELAARRADAVRAARAKPQQQQPTEIA